MFYFKDYPHFLQIKALILLGATSGLRAEEIYQLKPEDINLEERMVQVVHNLSNNQSTKTGKSRISFFTDITKEAIQKYFDYYDTECNYSRLFPQTAISRLFHPVFFSSYSRRRTRGSY